MRTAKTHIRQHGKDKFELLHGPEKSLTEQNKAFKAMRSEAVNDKIAEVHYQESDGPLRVVTFITTAEKKAREEAHAKAVAEAKKAAEEQEKKEAKAGADKAKKAEETAKANAAAQKKASDEAKKAA